MNNLLAEVAKIPWKVVQQLRKTAQTNFYACLHNIARSSITTNAIIFHIIGKKSICSAFGYVSKEEAPFQHPDGISPNVINPSIHQPEHVCDT